MRGHTRLRTLSGLGPIGLMPVAALGVHQLRYYLAYGAGWQAELARTGHSYLHSVVPWLVLLLALTLGSFLGRLGRAYSGYRSLGRYATSLVGLWLVCTLALVTIFACQEFLEGLFVTGHPAGLVGIFGYGGWWAAIPVAACFGLMLATLFHGALWVLDAVADVAIRLDETPAHPRHRWGPVEHLDGRNPGPAILECRLVESRRPPR